MKKLLLLLCMFGASASFADESYLYWMVGMDDVAKDIVYNSVKFMAYDQSGVGTALTVGLNSQGQWAALSATGNEYSKSDLAATEASGSGFYASLGQYAATGYTYVIELWNDSKFVAQGYDPLSYSDASQYLAMTSAGTGLQQLADAWKPSSYAVPEPNSALLMVLGCAALALRRRKMVKG